MSKVAVRIGPADHGRRMSLEEFEPAEGQEGYLYELARGVVTVMDVPSIRHGIQIDLLHQQLAVYRARHPGVIERILGTMDCKVLVPDLESERHPDLSIYKSPPPRPMNWYLWIPDLVIEVVSPSSVLRDYVEKREEYLRLGVREYWVVDAERREVLVLRRWGKRWREQTVRPPEVYRPRLLPGFELDCAALFQEADAYEE